MLIGVKLFSNLLVFFIFDVSNDPSLYIMINPYCIVSKYVKNILTNI